MVRSESALDGLTAGDLVERKKTVRRVMEAVMKPGEHYGTFPGGKKPSLWKAGAEALQSTFGIVPTYEWDDRSNPPEFFRYIVKCRGLSPNGVPLGEGMGECSTLEDKQNWRDVYLSEEFETAAETHRRVKYTRNRDKAGNPIVRRQVRQWAPDNANTVLKIAKKRAFVDMILGVTGASDMFTQDLEDVPAVDAGEEAKPAPAAGIPMAFVMQQPEGISRHMKPALILEFVDLCQRKGLTPEVVVDTLRKGYGVESVDSLNADQLDAICKKLRGA